MLQRRHELTYTIASMSTIAVATAAIIGYGGMRVLTGELTAGALVAFYGYIGTIFLPVNTVVGLFARYPHARQHPSPHRAQADVGGHSPSRRSDVAPAIVGPRDHREKSGVRLRARKPLASPGPLPRAGRQESG